MAGRDRESFMRKVLVATDGSDNAKRALDYAVSLSDPGQTLTIHLLYVYEDVSAGDRSHAFHSNEELERPQREHGEALVKAEAARTGSSGASIVPEVLMGDVADTIARHAEFLDCDSIIMGLKEQTLLAELVIGSTTRAVLHKARLPVTLVK
jgi:nucleotide-binding universal stress UspA family protein